MRKIFSYNRLYTVLLLFVILFCGGCSLHEKGVEGLHLAKEKLAEIHLLFNGQDFAEIWETAHKDFKTAQEKADVISFYSSIYNKLGIVRKSENIDWQVTSKSDLVDVFLKQKTVFGKVAVNEEFTFRIEDKSAFLYDYVIESNSILLENSGNQGKEDAK